METSRENQRRRLQRHSVSAAGRCSLFVITESCELSRYAVRIVDISMTGVGVESDDPIKPGIIWFKECLWGHNCGVMVWCGRSGPRYRAGIEFLSLPRHDEEWLKRQVESPMKQDSREAMKAVVSRIVKNANSPKPGSRQTEFP